jgi:repressor LexA
MEISELTYTQKKIYYSIKDYIDKYGYSPTFRELCDLNRINSTATIHYHLKNLKNANVIDYQPKKSRTIRIIK